jgi:glycosyltransferase involved in cell wall biosynthesis
MRWLYWHFDKSATKVDRAVFLNDRLISLRRKIKVLDKKKKYDIVPIGTDPKLSRRIKSSRPIRLGFIGVLKKSQGLDLVFDQAERFPKRFKNISLEIIGDGPDSKHYQERSKNSPLDVRFHGLQTNSKVINNILRHCTIGLAPYVPEPNNVSYYGDPSKIKNYLSVGLPVITTNVFVFSKEIEGNKAGIIINYFRPQELHIAITTITKNYPKYHRNAQDLAQKYHYKKIYSSLFKF